MGTTTAQMGLSKPTLGGDSGSWDDQLNSSLDLIDTHTHVSGQGARIPAAGLNITSDLTFAGTAALTNAKAVGFTAQSAYTVARSLFVRSSDNELMWRSHAGADIQITSGATLNLSLVGGIGGDYAAAGASFYYDDANEVYRALNAAPLPNDWARVAMGDLDLYENGSGITTRVRLSSPAALAGSYALTFPAALPAATRVLQVSSAGAISAGGAIASDGLITASAGLTAGVDQHVTVSGTGIFKHGDKVVQIPMIEGRPTPNGGNEWTGLVATTNALCWATPTGANNDVWFPVSLPVGARIKTVIAVIQDTAGANTLTMALYETNATADTTTSVGSGSSSGDGTVQAISTGAITVTIITNRTYHVRVRNNSATTTTHRIFGVQVTYDQP
jgi:hypothetical protein